MAEVAGRQHSGRFPSAGPAERVEKQSVWRRAPVQGCGGSRWAQGQVRGKIRATEGSAEQLAKRNRDPLLCDEQAPSLLSALASLFTYQERVSEAASRASSCANLPELSNEGIFLQEDSSEQERRRPRHCMGASPGHALHAAGRVRVVHVPAGPAARRRTGSALHNSRHCRLSRLECDRAMCHTASRLSAFCCSVGMPRAGRPDRPFPRAWKPSLECDWREKEASWVRKPRSLSSRPTCCVTSQDLPRSGPLPLYP